MPPQYIHPVIRDLNLSETEINRVTHEEEQELLRREQAYRGDRPPLAIEDRIVIVVDDGLATGIEHASAIAAVRQGRPGRIIVAVPVAAQETCEELREGAEVRVPSQVTCSLLVRCFIDRLPIITFPTCLLSLVKI